MTDPNLFDRFASTYSGTVNSAIRASGESADFFAQLKTDHVRRVLGPASPRSILDFGCGVGISTRALARSFPSAQVIGCDASSESISAARGEAESMRRRIRFVVHGQSGLPLDDSSVDVVFAGCVFHHIDAGGQAAWLRELRRVLAINAPLFIFEHNPYNPLTLQVVKSCPFDEGVRLLRPRYAARLVRSAGFRVDRPHYYFFFPRMLRCLRPLERRLDWFPLGGQYYVVGWRDS